MRVEVWVHGEGDGVADAPALVHVRELMGSRCLDARGGTGWWSVGVVEVAEGLMQAAERAAVEVQAAAAAAGLPNFRIVRAEARGPEQEVREVDGVVTASQQMMAAVALGPVPRSWGDEGPTGVREPRNPTQEPPGLSAAGHQVDE